MCIYIYIIPVSESSPPFRSLRPPRPPCLDRRLAD